MAFRFDLACLLVPCFLGGSWGFLPCTATLWLRLALCCGEPIWRKATATSRFRSEGSSVWGRRDGDLLFYPWAVGGRAGERPAVCLLAAAHAMDTLSHPRRVEGRPVWLTLGDFLRIVYGLSGLPGL